MVDWLVVPQALWLFLPAYVANMTPPVAAKLFPAWGAPIDAGKTARDGKPLLGASKTWRGVLAGGVAGVLTCVLQATRPESWPFDDFGFSATGTLAPAVLIGLLVGLAAGVGDSVKSYFKRRTDRKSGAPWFPFDQLDFVVFGLAFGALAGALVAAAGGPNWFVDSFITGDGPWRLIVIFVLTPGLHFLVNVLGYWIGVKKVPW